LGKVFREIDPKSLKGQFRVNVMGLLYLARETAPDLIDRVKGALLCDRKHFFRIRGNANFAGFARQRGGARFWPSRCYVKWVRSSLPSPMFCIGRRVDNAPDAARMSDWPGRVSS